jgi:hypothetical protein
MVVRGSPFHQDRKSFINKTEGLKSEIQMGMEYMKDHQSKESHYKLSLK